MIETRIAELMEHIRHVQDLTYKLGIRLIELGESDEGRMLIANGQIHDNSKWWGIEWEHLIGGDPLLKECVHHHNACNKHHPEAWGGIHKMPDVYIAEMVCDWVARSSELGSSVIDWVDGKAMERFGYSINDPVYAKIKRYLNLILHKFS